MYFLLYSVLLYSLVFRHILCVQIDSVEDTEMHEVLNTFRIACAYCNS